MIKLVCLNVERSKHLDRIMPFLEAENADVICLQEVVETDIPLFEKYAGACVVNARTCIHEGDEPEKGDIIDCNVIFTRHDVLTSDTIFYAGDPTTLPRQTVTKEGAPRTEPNRLLSFIRIQKESETFCIANTHFTWSSRGLATELQRTDMQALLETLPQIGGFVLCGDFNAPRGGEIFAMLADKYKDEIPERYKTSIDVNLHRAGHLPSEQMDQKMVDGLFSTPEYAVSDVELHSGVSDHMAITATIGKA
jgi:endonuclease/exonuclease/phosphatase family metal-dependent hydrolase